MSLFTETASIITIQYKKPDKDSLAFLGENGWIIHIKIVFLNR